MHPLASPVSLRVVALLAFLPILVSCSTQPATSVATATARSNSPEPSPFQGLRKGMPINEVRAQFGTPAHIERISNGDLKSEVWTYNRPVKTMTTQAATSVRQVDTVDPISGREFTMSEPVLQTVIVRLVETVKLLVIDDKLTEWKTTRETTRNF